MEPGLPRGQLAVHDNVPFPHSTRMQCSACADAEHRAVSDENMTYQAGSSFRLLSVQAFYDARRFVRSLRGDSPHGTHYRLIWRYGCRPKVWEDAFTSKKATAEAKHHVARATLKPSDTAQELMVTGCTDPPTQNSIDLPRLTRLFCKENAQRGRGVELVTNQSPFRHRKPRTHPTSVWPHLRRNL